MTDITATREALIAHAGRKVRVTKDGHTWLATIKVVETVGQLGDTYLRFYLVQIKAGQQVYPGDWTFVPYFTKAQIRAGLAG